MRIAICDTDVRYVKETKRLIYQYSNRQKLDLMVDEFFSGQSLLISSYRYDIIFLGYNTGSLNGLETAEKLRENCVAGAIIFISGNTGFILDSFRVNPFRFLVKPVKADVLFATLDDFFKKFGLDYPLWLKYADDTICINTNDILYLEADNKHCYVNLKNERISCHKTMAKVFSALPKNHFCKINRAFVVNFNYITRYNSDMIVLSSGEKLHISRKYYTDFKEDYRRFSNPSEP